MIDRISGRRYRRESGKRWFEIPIRYRTKEFAGYLTTSGLGSVDVGIDQFTKQVKDEHAKWGKLIKAHNIQM